MSINRIMNQGKTGLAAAQTGISTVSHNISNVNTEGYSRQRVDFVAADATGKGNMRLGGGVKVGSVSRASSDFVNRRLEEESTTLGQFEGMSDLMTQLETVLKDDGEQGLSKGVSQFFNDIRSLSTQPESQPLRAAVRESANSVVGRFRSMMSGVDQVKQDLDRRVEGAVLDLNMFTTRISDLNRRIMELEVAGTGLRANDERDARDLALQQLSKIVDVQITPIENGGINVAAGRLGVLVNGTEPSQFATVHGEGDNGGGAIRIHQVGVNGRVGKDVTEFVNSGSLGGYVKVRDTMIPKVTSDMNAMAYKLTESVNAVHRQAYGTNGKTGMDFFTPVSRANAANAMAVSNEVMSDTNAIASGFKLGASGDNRGLLAIADLQDQKIFNGGTATFTDHAAGIVGTLGVELKSVNENLETQRGLVEQLGSVRERIAGVSLDEEAINMIQFQKAFDASAKMIQVADNLMDTVLNLKRF